VSMLTTSPGKLADAAKLGAKDGVLMSDAAQVKASRNRYDFILSTIPQSHDIMPYVQMLRRDGVLVLVGAIDGKTMAVSGAGMIMGRKTVAGSVIGGLPETQAMVDFCAANGVAADIELIAGNRLDEAYKRIKAKDVRYRFVLDMTKVA
jgi:alcohol dehydrogenase (NADP+)